MAEILGSVKVSGFIAPTSETDIYPSHDSKYGKGGWREVATLLDRDLITVGRRAEGMAVYVQETDTVYILKDGLDNTNWALLQTGGGSSYQSASIDFSSYEEIVALENDDYILISRGGNLKKIKVSNARDYFNPSGYAVMVGDDFIVANGQYVVVS